MEVKLVVGAMNDEAKLKFLHALEASPAFTHVELVNERIAPPGTPGGDHLEVELRAVYSRT